MAVTLQHRGAGIEMGATFVKNTRHPGEGRDPARSSKKRARERARRLSGLGPGLRRDDEKK
jgi:hypothetical protein